MYEGLRLKNRMHRVYNFVQVLRRIVFVCIALEPLVVMSEGFTIISVITLNWWMSFYMYAYQPFRSKSKNRMECFNELTIISASLMLSSYSSYVPNAELKDFNGRITIVMICFNMIVNWLAVFTALFAPVYRYLRLRYLKFTARRINKKEKD